VSGGVIELSYCSGMTQSEVAAIGAAARNVNTSDISGATRTLPAILYSQSAIRDPCPSDRCPLTFHLQLHLT
jgi:hypothetical protein